MTRQISRFALVVLAISLIATLAAADESQGAWAALAKGGHAAAWIQPP